ncbi:hypothetical protein BGX34_009778 [Mortierella sp. NVP85]|nr:hypothetical protein BGX34_009778 [Mortierella sp. NVP85]
MTGPTGALSDSLSPLRLRKTNSPFLTRAMFEAATSKSQQAQVIFEAEDSDDSNINEARRDSFDFTKCIRNIRHPEMNPGDKPKDGRVSKLITSFSIPSLLQAQTYNSSLSGFKVDRETPEFRRRLSMTSQMLAIPGKEWVRALQKDSNEAPSLDLDPFSPYSPGILDPEKVVSTQQTTVAKTLIDLNEYCQRVDVRPREEEEEEIRESKKEDEKTEKEEEDDGRQVRRAIMVALEFSTLTLNIKLCIIINPEATIDISKTIEPNTSAVEVAIVPGAVEERGQAVSGTIKSMVETSVDSVANVSTPSVERTTESEAIVKRWRRDQSTSPQIQQPDILALHRDAHYQPPQDPQLSRNRRQQKSWKPGLPDILWITIARFEYDTVKKLGKGNFGIVYQGKKIQDGVEFNARCEFNNKAGIVPLLDIITTSKHHYLVFEKVEGDLAGMIRTRCKEAGERRSSKDMSQQPMSPPCSLGAIFSIEEIRSLMHTVILGTQALHREGYSHKDIKPANILSRDDKGLLCGFGLCSQGNKLPQNQFFGTQDYASPEARRVGGHRRSNYVQETCAVLYELATGSVLYKVISKGLNWQKIVRFGGRDFSELLQGMVNNIEKR